MIDRVHNSLLLAGALVLAGTAVAVAFGSRRIAAEQRAYSEADAPRCQQGTLNRSAALPGTSLSASPLPGSKVASTRTQISLLGAPAQALGAVSATGSESGTHGGRLRGYSQGDGASFIPSEPFLAGETVTVVGKLKTGTRTQRFTYQFSVATKDVLPYSKPTPPSGKDPNEKQHFRSRPDLEPPSLIVNARSPESAGGDIFAAPYAGPGPPGPMIFDEAGNLVWFNPLPKNIPAAANLQVQQLGGRPVLSWWQGYIPPQGFGQGEGIIADSSYRQLGRVRAGNGYKADLHELKLTPQSTALLTVYNPIACNLSSVGGPSGGAVTDSVFQEIDLRTALVRREWHSLDHVALRDSYSSATGASKKRPFDYFHINSIDQRADGITLISARNTSSLYELSTTTGRLLRSIGGRRSDTEQAPGARTAYQHAATTLADGTISLFDNGAVPKVHPQSRGLVLAIDAKTNTVSVAKRYEHRPALSSGSQGNIQQLPNQDMFIGWGSEPYFTEYSADGRVLFDARMHGSYESYRAYRFPWTGAPRSSPTLAAAHAPAQRVTVYASWNGDTRTASWRVLAGASTTALAPVTSAPRAGFETAISTADGAKFLAVQALDASGAVLASSRAIRG